MPTSTASRTPILLHNVWGETAILHPWGGQVLSWCSARGSERLFVSPSTALPGRGVVRGGVPVVFPQFGRRGPLGAHGFARQSWWQKLPPVRASAAALVLTVDAQTEPRWPHPCVLRLEADIGVRGVLRLRLGLHNTGNAPLAFGAALHTYLALDARHARLDGLLPAQTLPLHGPIDQVHPAPAGALRLRARGPVLQLEQSGFAHTVVWNPGPGHTLADLPARGWQDFACVEAAQVEPLTLPAGQQWLGEQVLRLR